jgi:D-amino-acid dehydrogenase
MAHGCLQLLRARLADKADLPSMDRTMSKVDCIVLGAGIVGVATALHLQRAGRQTILVDRRGPGEETSFGNATLIERSSVYPYMFPTSWRDLLSYAFNRKAEANYHLSHVFKLAPWLYQYWRQSTPENTLKIAAAHLPLIENCLKEHEVLAAEAGASHLLRPLGWIDLFRSPQKLEKAWADFESRAAYGVMAEYLDPARIAALEPHIADRFVGAVKLKEPVSVADPYALTMAYVAQFEKLGGRFVKGDATKLQQGDAGWRLATDTGLIEAKDAVCAMGAWSDLIFGPLGYRIPLEVKRGYHMHYKTAGNAVLNHPFLDAESGYLLIPMGNGTIRLTTGAEFAHRDAPKSPVQLGKVERVARDVFPLGERVDAEPWMGRRPCLPDMLPVIGPASRHNGLWFAFGHQHHGLTNAAVTGRLIAEMITGKETFCDPRPYRADRF